MQTKDKIKVGIVGGTGYTGVELLRLLSAHPRVQLHAITSRAERGLAVADMFSSLRGIVDLAFTSPDETDLTECDVVFFATPHGVAMSQAAHLLEHGVRIIDLAADFRLQDTQLFEHWYKMPHACPDILRNSVYGLVERNRDKITDAQVIANPGCYPTTVILGLLPLLEQDLIDEQSIIADCKSGTSGAGRKAAVSNLLSETSDNFKAYGVTGHRHHPEITEQLESIAGKPVGLTFVPHLVPMIRGMFSTLYVKLKDPADASKVQAIFETRYRQEQFIDVLPSGQYPETRSVRASNYLRIAIAPTTQDGNLVILVVQDNLVKGASGQAIQNMNLMFGFPEQMSLEQTAVLP